MLIGETFYYAEEAYTALKVMKKTGLPTVSLPLHLWAKIL